MDNYEIDQAARARDATDDMIRMRTDRKAEIAKEQRPGRDAFDHKASCIVEDHIRAHSLTVVPHPDHLKDAIAAELRLTWNDAIEAAKGKVAAMLKAR